MLAFRVLFSANRREYGRERVIEFEAFLPKPCDNVDVGEFPMNKAPIVLVGLPKSRCHKKYLEFGAFSFGNELCRLCVNQLFSAYMSPGLNCSICLNKSPLKTYNPSHRSPPT